MYARDLGALENGRLMTYFLITNPIIGVMGGSSLNFTLFLL
ncbi:MAG: hypothetical protein R3E31_07520 [Chloroflexota bacterium]